MGVCRCEIDKINIYKDRFLIARTAETLLMGDMETCKLSEIPWNGDGKHHHDYDQKHVYHIYIIW